jgi:hypothetical protein
LLHSAPGFPPSDGVHVPEGTHVSTAHTSLCEQSVFVMHSTHTDVAVSQIVRPSVAPRQARLFVQLVGAVQVPWMHRSGLVHSLSNKHSLQSPVVVSQRLPAAQPPSAEQGDKPASEMLLLPPFAAETPPDAVDEPPEPGAPPVEALDPPRPESGPASRACCPSPRLVPLLEQPLAAVTKQLTNTNVVPREEKAMIYES